MTENLKRDRDGEPFQDTFTENRGSRRPAIEEGQHKLNLDGDQVEDGENEEESNAAEKEHKHP